MDRLVVHSLGTSPVVLKSWNCSHSSSLQILWFRFSYSSYFMFSQTFSNSSHLSKSCTYEEYYFLFLSIGERRLSLTSHYDKCGINGILYHLAGEGSPACPNDVLTMILTADKESLMIMMLITGRQVTDCTLTEHIEKTKCWSLKC